MYLIQEIYYSQKGILTLFLGLNLQSKHKPTKVPGTMKLCQWMLLNMH